ncbi:MAG: amidase family protein [Salinirussus sp.]
MGYPPPTVRPPSAERVADLADRFHMDLSPDELAVLAEGVADTVESYERLESLGPGRAQTLDGPERAPGFRPDDETDPLNAFITRCQVSGSDTGPLAGLDIGIKDNIAVAGVEMTAASRMLEGYIPRRDATAVARLLEAGATVVGKLNMDNLAVGGSGELSAFGPVLNPRDPERLAGGSSGGSAAAVVAGDVDVALGTDQGGSIRSPAALCGCVGLKPTYGLVPYTGGLSLAVSVDHIGPLAMSVEPVARTLETIAGPDPEDPRARDVQTAPYTDALGVDPSELTIGILDQGFNDEVTESVTETVHEALDAIADAGATVRTVSVPLHDDAMAIWRGIVLEGAAATLESDGIGRFHQGGYDEFLAEAYGRGRRVAADDMPVTLKMLALSGAHLSDSARSRYYARAQTLRGDLRAAYTAALADVDVLAMPTRRDVAIEHREDLSLAELLDRGRAGFRNRAAFNVTGHPAVSVPAGHVDDLPVGLEFVGKHFDDGTVLAAAEVVERTIDWAS